MWKVRAEITGEFVIGETFDNYQEAEAYYEKLEAQGIWEELDMWEI